MSHSLAHFGHAPDTKPLIALLCSAVLGLAGAAAEAPREWTADPASVAHALDAAWPKIERRDPALGAREVAVFVAEGAALKWRTDRLEAALGLLRELQDQAPQSATFGNLRWYVRQPEVHDRNAVEFVVQTLVVLARDHTSGLTPRGRELLGALLKDAAEGMRRHKVPEDYTNIFLMKSVNCLLLGEQLGDAPLAEEGRAMLRRWLAFTAKDGVTEYNSPTYSGTDLDSLALVAKFARRQEDRAVGDVALQVLWTEMAANWFAPCERLGGAHSRDYDFLTGRGWFDVQAWFAGWTSRRPNNSEGIGGKEGAMPVAAFVARAWRPPADWIEPLQHAVPRMVYQRWGAEPWTRASHYVGHRFSLGSAGAARAFDDKVFTLNLAGDSATPMMNYVMDFRGDPYGKHREVGNDGHAKALHLIPFVASAQDGPEALVLASDDPSQPRHRRPAGTLTGLWSHVVLPREGRLLDAKGGVLSAGELSPNAPVFLRLGDVAVGIRFLVRRGCDGAEAKLHLVEDGDQYSARRLTVTHAEGAAPGRGTVAFWVRAVEGLDDAGFGKFAAEFSKANAVVSEESGRFRLSAAGRNGPLELDVEPAKNVRHEAAAPNAPDDGFLLTVNGRELWRPLLKSFAAP